MKKLLTITCLFSLLTVCKAQSSLTDSSVLIDPTLNHLQNKFLNNQAEALLNEASKILSNYPPNLPEPPERRSALLLLDGVLHEVYAPKRSAVQNYFKKRIKNAIEEIELTKVISGAHIWKLYNHGFVIRTKSVTFGFDLVSGKSAGNDDFLIGVEYIKRLVNQCDVLFISHEHGDHAEKQIAQFFIDQGKPVVAPTVVWRDNPVYDHITHFERKPHIQQRLKIKDGKQELNVVVYPGHQGPNIENNVYLVTTPEGLSFSQTGDQANDNDFNWIDEVNEYHKVDVFLPNCWITDIVRTIKGFNPTLIITGHENEMGHTIDHREPYWLSYQRQKGSDRFGGKNGIGYDKPLLLMTWGESYHYKK